MTAPSTDDREAGFTIVEVLVALALVAVALAAIGSLMATNIRGVRTLERHVALTQAVRTVMTEDVPSRAALVPGTSSGQADNYRWTVDVSPLGDRWIAAGDNAPWVPQLVRVRVRSPTGAVSDIRTVRLIPKAAK